MREKIPGSLACTTSISCSEAEEPGNEATIVNTDQQIMRRTENKNKCWPCKAASSILISNYCYVIHNHNKIHSSKQQQKPILTSQLTGV